MTKYKMTKSFSTPLPWLPLLFVGPIAWWQAWVQQPELPVWTHAPVAKRSRQNYTLLNGANSLQRMTVPTDRRSRRAYYDSVLVNYGRPWQRTHLHAYPTIYHNSPYFEHYWPELEPLLSASPERLIDYGLPLAKWIAKQLRPEAPLRLMETVDQPDYRHWALTAHCAPEGFAPPDYYHLFTHDEQNVSVLDLLFCEGPQSRLILSAADR